MGINVNKYKVLAFILSGAFLGVMAIFTISYGSSMVAVTGMASMSRNFVPTMGCFFGLAFKKYGMPLQAIVIGEVVINTPLPAISDAIRNAVGKRFYELPITPEKIAMAALEKK